MSPKECMTQTADATVRLKEKVLAECPKLGREDTFHFACHPGVSCFRQCCRDVNIFLSPYDVLRIKKRLGISSTEFLEKYALLPVQKDMRTPVVVLRMNDDEEKTCSFLAEDGCGIYSDRPWPCRMYPLGFAAQKNQPGGAPGDQLYFLQHEQECMGQTDLRVWKVREWLADQGLDKYEEWGEMFKELTLHDFFEQGGVLSPEKMQMLFTACYDLDKFREFVFKSTLLERFEFDDDYVEELRYNDEALLRFGFQWLRFGLFGEPTMKPKPEVTAAFKGKLDKRSLFDKQKANHTQEESA